MMVALLDWYQYDGDSKWLELTGRMANSLAELALKNEDRAWYYQAYTRSGAWTGRGVPREKPAHLEPPKVNPQDIGNALRAFSRWYVVSGDKKALDLAHRLARFMLKPTMWGARGEEMVVAGEHGRWSGHFHTNTTGLIGLAEYAIASNDARAKRIADEAYQHARSVGISRIGFFPAVIRPASQKQPSDAGAGGTYPQVSETCGVADMIALAIRLSESGIGDYWDHVDQYVRNHLVECQMLRRDLLEEIIAASPTYEIDPTSETADNVLERNIGAFVSGSDPTWLYAWYTMCCQGNGSLALAEAWKAILDHADGVVQVNLLLNRASPWMDVDSYLPYEGKVVLKNKRARKLHVRIPSWVDKKAVRCHVNDRPASPHWLSNYLMVEGLGRSDVVKVEFPVPESTEKFSLPSYGRQYIKTTEAQSLDEAGLIYSCRGEEFVEAYKIDDWNTARLRVTGTDPHVTTWINDLKICEFDGPTTTNQKYAQNREEIVKLIGQPGSIAVQVHLGSDWPVGARCRWKEILVRTL